LKGIVVDASVTLAWCFPGEASNYAEQVLAALEEQPIVVPVLWLSEVANGVLVGERRKRLKQPEIRRFIELLRVLPISLDERNGIANIANVLSLGKEYAISAYDAAYLDVALRHAVPLATLDEGLLKAGEKAGVEIFRA
jgi:predicted nucleic acid-binding protein